ncbi:hypothetical protein [Shewanella sp. FJAT-52076]|uniref:hypothetical protein n=1 Tax=Shewanella sp. FJAT-52076 TaxID=2864202 RepID=UPI001C65F5FF|nr:hypothetical protein [Shewanella sp. FJAT-52076]QYJ75787.1 hypothetical protein K0H79_01990 [Shewanella sp. FJAT-52076]
MKFRYLNNWDNPRECKELVYFSQLLEEMLFDFSLDTYKPSALNTSLLCVEALDVINDIENGVIKGPNLDHVLEELTERLKRDRVAASLIKSDLEQILAILQNKKKFIAEKKVVLELLWSQINLPAYRKKNEELLIIAVSTGGDFNEIRSLARSFITTLKNYGFSSKWLYEKTIYFFHEADQRISSNNDISRYIEFFRVEKKEYIAIYRASNIFKTIKDSCEKINLEVSDEIEDCQTQIKDNGFTLSGDETYVAVRKLKANELYSAREESDTRMELMQTFLTLFHHKEHPAWSDECLIITADDMTSAIISKPINPMLKCIDLRAKKASKRLNSFISEFSLDEDSLSKFARSSELHSLALSSDSIENQMINLWIALESLIPPSTDDISTIENIVNSSMPFLTLNYINRMLDRLSSDLFNWNRNELSRALRGIDGDSFRSKLAKLLVLDQHQQKRDRLDRSFRDFHLLRNRFFYIASMISDPKRIVGTIADHEERVAWQLRRIYRARNIIVHSGRTPSATSALIENIHDYLDIIMSTLVTLASQRNSIHSVNQGFKFIEINAAANKKAIKHLNEEQYKKNLDDALFKYGI